MPSAARIMPPQCPGNSRQDYCTPRAFLDAVEREFGPIVWDLAATYNQSVLRHTDLQDVHREHCYFGPDHMCQDMRDSLARPWISCVLPACAGLLWLNPPYSRIAPWAAKCAAESQLGARIAFLVPASIGAAWYWDHCAPYARTFSIGRLTFVNRLRDGVTVGTVETPACLDAKGRPTPYPKDLLLVLYDVAGGMTPGIERWKWQAGSAGMKGVT